MFWKCWYEVRSCYDVNTPSSSIIFSSIIFYTVLELFHGWRKHNLWMHKNRYNSVYCISWVASINWKFDSSIYSSHHQQKCIYNHQIPVDTNNWKIEIIFLLKSFVLNWPSPSTARSKSMHEAYLAKSVIPFSLISSSMR